MTIHPPMRTPVAWALRLAAAAIAAAALASGPAAAQDPPGDTPAANQAVDFRIAPEIAPAEPEYEDCSDESAATAAGGEIVVCLRKKGEEVQMWSKEDWENRYAAKTAFQGKPRTPDLAGPGITGAGPGVGVRITGCMIPPCPPPAAYMIDFAALPETPPGSDADRVGRGLAPRGYEGEPTGPAPVMQPGSASPAAPQ